MVATSSCTCREYSKHSRLGHCASSTTISRKRSGKARFMIPSVLTGLVGRATLRHSAAGSSWRTNRVVGRLRKVVRTEMLAGPTLQGPRHGEGFARAPAGPIHRAHRSHIDEVLDQRAGIEQLLRGDDGRPRALGIIRYRLTVWRPFD